MAKVYLLLGGNIGNRFYSLTKALEQMEKEVGQLVKKSSFFETEPWGFEHEENFWNQAIVIETSLTPEEVLKQTQKIELDLGRVRKEVQYCERTIDIDILFYEDQIVDTENLTIPHPRLHERMFALSPMEEIASELVHPVLKKPISQLKSECKDMLRVIQIANEKE